MKLTAKVLESDSPWEIAKDLGIHYTGDVNPFDHDGCFYELSNWKEYGYACVVRVMRYDGRIAWEAGTVNWTSPAHMEDAYRCCGVDADELTADSRANAEVECLLAYSGMEVDSSKEFDGEVKERKFWKSAKSEILLLVPETAVVS